MNHLRELRFDKIKIDKSFILSMGSNPESAKIVSAILGLTRSLGLPTTAEGIEDADAVKQMIEGGCEFGQGFYFSRAVPAEEVADLIGRSMGRKRAAGKR
jgi:EAL domain-containing protein (putative c-di-GMP-specific phosphodiesterase class I)